MAARSGVKLVLDTLAIEELQGSESCHRTVSLVGIYAIVVFDIGDDALDEIALEEGSSMRFFVAMEPLGMTTTMGCILPSARRLSRILQAQPTPGHEA